MSLCALVFFPFFPCHIWTKDLLCDKCPLNKHRTAFSPHWGTGRAEAFCWAPCWVPRAALKVTSYCWASLWRVTHPPPSCHLNFHTAGTPPSDLCQLLCDSSLSLLSSNYTVPKMPSRGQSQSRRWRKAGFWHDTFPSLCIFHRIRWIHTRYRSSLRSANPQITIHHFLFVHICEWSFLFVLSHLHDTHYACHNSFVTV